LVTWDRRGTVTVLLNNGDGSLQSLQTFSTGYSFGGPFVLADTNGDGKPDLLARGNRVLGVALGNGDGTFQAPQTFATPGQPSEPILTDVNGDGKPDVVMTLFDHLDHYLDIGEFCVLLGNGDGT